MCCVFTALLLFGPRLAVLVWWLVNQIRFATAFNNTWILPLLGFIFLPWTVLMYMIIFPGGITGFDWIWLGLGVFLDLASYTGGGWGNRDRLRG